VKFARFLLASVLFLLVLVLVYWVHARYFRVDVVLYDAVLDVVVATAICSPLLLLPPFRLFSRFERLQMLAIWGLAGYAIALSVPTVLDRSLSFYILEKLAQRGGGIRVDAMPSVFREEYMREHQLVLVRLTEQERSGTIEVRGGCVLLTERGRRLAGFSRWFRTHLLPRHRLLGSNYSDALTDPFRNSVEASGYRCRAPGAR
jgi:hypothetical protein